MPKRRAVKKPSSSASADDPIFAAVETGDLARMSELLNENPARVHFLDAVGRTPLHIAARRDRLDVVSALLAAGTDLDARGAGGVRPLHVA